MKSLSLVSTATLCLATFACSTAANAPVSAAAGTSAGGSEATAGTASALGGAGGSGNSTSGGGTTSGGASAAGTGAGGVLQTGGTAAGGGAGTGTGGSTGGTGGGAAGGAGGGGAVDTTLVGSWDGALLTFPCGATGSGYDCAQPAATMCKTYNAASNPVISTIHPANSVPDSWTMGGTAGTVYNVTFHLLGVVEVTSYVGGTRLGDASVLTLPRNLFQVGGTAQPNSGPSFDYNTFELDVTPPVASATANTYFLNSVTTAQNPHAAGTPTTHLTFNIDYSATIKVPGGGKVTLKVTDTNCVQVQNCGDTAGNTCLAPRTVSLAGATPPAPSFAQPLSTGTLYGQWLFFDITSVTVAQ